MGGSCMTKMLMALPVYYSQMENITETTPLFSET